MSTDRSNTVDNVNIDESYRYLKPLKGTSVFDSCLFSYQNKLIVLSEMCDKWRKHLKIDFVGLIFIDL